MSACDGLIAGCRQLLQWGGVAPKSGAHAGSPGPLCGPFATRGRSYTIEGEVSGGMESLLGAVHADFQVVDQGFGQGAEDAGGAGGDLVVFHFGFAG